MAIHVLVVGAGASGLMAAITAARAGAKVTVLEAMERPGKKLLLTGSGRCNLTNTDEALAEAYRCSEDTGIRLMRTDGSIRGAAFAAQVLGQFDSSQTREFFHGLGLLTVERDGYVYPLTNQAGSVLAVLLQEVRRLGIRLKLSEKVEGISRGEKVWKVRTATWTYEADRVILCCGSKCYPPTGSDGSGYALAEQAGLALARPVPALVPLVCEGNVLPGLAGLRCRAKVTLLGRRRGRGKYSEEAAAGWHVFGTETGEVQWTKYGASGIAVFQLSRYVSLADSGEEFQLSLNFLYLWREQEIGELLDGRAAALGQEPATVLPEGLLPEKLIPAVLEAAGISRRKKCRDLSEADLRRLCSRCMDFRLPVIGTKSFDVCQVCAGGVRLPQVSPQTLECRELPGLYLAGELLDLDGPCGGYNLQWAWASGYVAGSSAAD